MNNLMERLNSIRTILLTCSIGVNVLLGLDHFRRSGESTTPRGLPDKTDSSLHGGKELSAEGVQPSSSHSNCNWSDIDNPDPYELVRRLTRLEFPRCVIEEILIGRLRENARSREITTTKKVDSFWKTGFGAGRAANMQKHLQQFEDAISDEASNILGEIRCSRVVRGTGDDLVLGIDFLPDDKKLSARRILQSFQRKVYEVRERSKGVLLPEDYLELAQLERDRRQSLLQVMDLDQLEQLDLRSSQTAETLRMTLHGFEPTESEFTAIFKLRRQFEEQIGSTVPPGTLDPLLSQQRAEAESAMENELEILLGDNRFRDFKRIQDHAFQGLLMVLDRFEVSPRVAHDVIDLKETVQAQIRLQKNQLSASEEQRSDILSALVEEAKAKVRGMLGDAAFDAYQRSGGQWLGRLGK